jgi:hypothetical protein
MKINNKTTAYQLVTALIIIVCSNVIYAGNIVLVPDTISIDKPHIHVVTNRPFQYDSLTGEYFPNSIAQDQTLTYLKVYTDAEGNWLTQTLGSVSEFTTNKSNYKDWLVYVHGDSQTLDLAFTRGLQIQEEYKVNVIVFSWPAKDPILTGLKNFSNSRNMVEKGVENFVQFIYELYQWKSDNVSVFSENNLSLFMHSLGNYYLERIIADSLQSKINAKIFDNIIINAAAVNEKDHRLWLEKINFSDNIFVNSNSNDMTLKGVRLFTDMDLQLGEKVEGEFASNATYIEFNKAMGTENSFRTSHGYYAGVIPGQSQNVYQYFSTIFHGRSIEFCDMDMFVQNANFPVFEIIN